MSSYLSSSSTKNYYKSLLQKNFTSYQVLEVFMFIFVGGLLIYAGMEIHKSEDLIKSLCSCNIEDNIKKELSKIRFPPTPATNEQMNTFLTITLPRGMSDLISNLGKGTPIKNPTSNNTLGWLLILMGVGTILLGLYRLFMKGTVADQ